MTADEIERRYPWYDAVWLTAYARAKSIITDRRPEDLARFMDAMLVFRTPPDFRVQHIPRLFDADTLADIKRVVGSIKPTDYEMHEARQFGRFVVHDLAFFNALQETLVPMVAEAVGEPVESSYNFLSLYSSLGVCAVHMDAPLAKWTLDCCLDQSGPWPIYFSQVQPWPESPADEWVGGDWAERIKRAPSNSFSTHALQPGEAVIFSGSSQWHYRDAIPQAAGRQFCDLLFFHFIPRGTKELVRPKNWARLFGIPELSELA